MTKILLSAFIAVAVAGCMSSTEPAADLDIKTSIEKPGDGQKVTYDDLTKNSKMVIPPDAVTNWQAFFKAPPASKERSILEEKLKRWQDTDTVAGQIAKGRAESALNNYAAAEMSFRKALRFDDDNHDALLELASLYLKKGDTQTAFELLAQVREATTTSERVTSSFIFKYRYVLALGYLARGEKDKGHAILSDLIGEVKTFSPAYIALASSYIGMGRLNVADFVMKRATDRIKNDASIFNLMGYIKQRSREPEAARRWYDQALAINPTYAAALVNRGNLNAQQFELVQAEKDLIAALIADPMSSDAMVSLGIVQKRQGNLAGARVSLTKAVEIDPNNAFARFNLGVILAKDFKHPTEAIRLFNEVLQTSNTPIELTDLARNYLADLQRSQTSNQ